MVWARYIERYFERDVFHLATVVLSAKALVYIKAMLEKIKYLADRVQRKSLLQLAIRAS